MSSNTGLYVSNKDKTKTSSVPIFCSEDYTYYSPSFKFNKITFFSGSASWGGDLDLTKVGPKIMVGWNGE